MQAFSFAATHIIKKDPEGFCHLVGFADNQYDTNHYLLLQRSFAEDEDEQDAELGLDTYHVEWCGQQNACYGGIAQLMLGHDGAQITFKRDAVQDMDGLEHLSIAFDLSADEYAELKTALAEIFAGEDCLELADGLAPGAESAA